MKDIREQYENWAYPLPVEDLDKDLKAGHFDRSDPSMFRRKLWPRPNEPKSLKILVAGCGTTQAARYAYRCRDCMITGIDLSKTSLAHEELLKNKHGLSNLRLHNVSILDIENVGEHFDLIVCTGVLHHLPDPDAGLRALRSVLSPHGVMSIMVYGWYRRFGVYMMQEAFRLLDVQQTREGIEIVRETLAGLPEWHHVNSYLRSAPDLTYDSGIVDTFLHRSDRAYSVPQIMHFASKNGLKFQDWMDRHDYSMRSLIPHNHPIRSAASRLSLEKQWHLVELLGQSIGMHGFLLCHPERNTSDYCIDFSTNDSQAIWLSYVPHIRPPTAVMQVSDSIHGTPAKLRRGHREFTLTPREADLFTLVNGQLTISEIIERCTSHSERFPEIREVAFQLFARMHDCDHLMFEIYQ